MAHGPDLACRGRVSVGFSGWEISSVVTFPIPLRIGGSGGWILAPTDLSASDPNWVNPGHSLKSLLIAALENINFMNRNIYFFVNDVIGLVQIL